MEAFVTRDPLPGATRIPSIVLEDVRLTLASAAGAVSTGRSAEVTTSTSSRRVTSTAGTTRASWNSPFALRSIAVTFPTGSPRGNTPSVPEVTSWSPSIMSSVRSM